MGDVNESIEAARTLSDPPGSWRVINGAIVKTGPYKTLKQWRESLNDQLAHGLRGLLMTDERRSEGQAGEDIIALTEFAGTLVVATRRGLFVVARHQGEWRAKKISFPQSDD